MSFSKIIKSHLIAVMVLGATCGWSQGKVDKMPSKIISPSYRIDHRNGVARTNLFLNNKLLMSLFWTQRWTNAKASDIKTQTTISKDKMHVTVHSTYKWAKGQVDETRTYTNDSIKLDYTYTPMIEKVKTGKVGLYFKFYDVTKKAFSYTKFGKSGGVGTFEDIEKNKRQLGICSSINVKNVAGKDIDIATDSKCRMFLENRKSKSKSQIMTFVAAADSWRKPYTFKGKKYHQSLVFDIIPAEGQKDITFAPLKVTF